MMKNKLGIADPFDLIKEEERISKQNAVKLFDCRSFKPGSWKSLSAIHKFLFDDIYYFAGTIRNTDLIKHGFKFVPANYLKSAIKAVEQMPQSTFEEIIKKYVEMNLVHPFNEGNGRSMRIWLNWMLEKEIGLVVDWSLVDKEDYLLAMERSPIGDIEIKYYLNKALSVNSRSIYLKSIDQSFYYEDLYSYCIKDLL